MRIVGHKILQHHLVDCDQLPVLRRGTKEVGVAVVEKPDGKHAPREGTPRSLVRRPKSKPWPEFAGREVAAAGKFDAEAHLIAAADLMDELTCDSVATTLGDNTEVDDLDPIGRKVEEHIAENLILVDCREQRAGGGAILKASVREESEPSLVGPVEGKNLAELLAAQSNFADRRRRCDCG